MITAMGLILAAGNNTRGQLGDGTMTPSHRSDYDLITSDQVFMTAVTAGSNHVLALSVDGTVWTWGMNDHGQLGDDTLNDRGVVAAVVVPNVWQGDKIVEYRPLDRVIATAAGPHHSLALLADGTVVAWGANDRGQLGDGTTDDRHTPVPVLSPEGPGLLSDIIALSTGNASSVALRADGTVWGWGSNDHGELGDGTKTDRPRPVQAGVTRVVAVSSRGPHTLALIADGTLRSWGSNLHGELGDNTSDERPFPARVKGYAGADSLTDVIAIAAGAHYSLALRADGRVWSWGNNHHGQLGDGTTNTRRTPVPVSGSSGSLMGITSIAAGAVHALALQGAGRVFGWGWNRAGELGDGTETERLLPVPVTDKLHFGTIAIAAGQINSFLIRVQTDARTWGANDKGQLAAAAGASSPFVTSPFAQVSQSNRKHHASVTGGEAHSLLLQPGDPQSTDSTKILSWGSNDSGQLGDGSKKDRSEPDWVPHASGLSNDAKAIAAGSGTVSRWPPTARFGHGRERGGTAGNRHDQGAAESGEGSRSRGPRLLPRHRGRRARCGESRAAC